ncbi:MAG: Flp pilus assembly complex ATPase component TadA [Candidatus Omnitrophica bacterium]|nr:Flp pilus assembly complex ATPase component TadA [Candidatus Omnitrophota bacterium]
MGSFRQRISELLIEQRLATAEQLASMVAEASQQGKSFAKLLIERNIVPEGRLIELLSKELGMPMISLTKYRLDPKVASLVPERLARQYGMIAISKFGDRLVVAMADPLNIFAIDDLKTLAQIDINPVLSPQSEILRAIEQVYTPESAIAASLQPEIVAKSEEGNLDTAVALLLNESGEQEVPVVRVINLLVIEAMRRHASDIHLEPMQGTLRVRFRIDGKLIDSHRLPLAVQNPVLTRLKIMSGMNITEWRIPQDGRFKVRLDDREVDFRVSLLPITHGGKVVLRLLELNQPTKNLITVEDPVEYQVEGITQVQVNPEVGLTFSTGLRALLRQSPDVVMVGEIRDFETADIAMKASLTGQLVLSTLHTNDAPSAVTRLIDMGVEPFLVASSVTLIQAQRLVRKLCQKCREPFRPDAKLLEKLEYKPDSKAVFYKAAGCRFCNNTGHRGRSGIVEVLDIDEHIRELIVSRAPSWEIKNYAVEKLGMVTLRQDGLEKASRGMTTLEEVVAVTAEE